MKTALVMLMMLCAGLHAEEGWILLPEPKFMAHEIVWAVPGSSRTVLLPAWRSGDGTIHPLTSSDVAGRKDLDVTRLRQEATQSASQLLARIEPTFIRDEHQAIRFAILESENPPAAACILAPEFREKFLETIGPDVLVVIPNRSTVYIFPRSDAPTRELSERAFIDYQGSNYPVSREVFDPAPGGLRAVGVLR